MPSTQVRNLSQNVPSTNGLNHANTANQFVNMASSNIRKQSVGTAAATTSHLTTKSGNILQKSLGTLDYKQSVSKSGKNSSIKRQQSTSHITRSRDKLPEIDLTTKLSMYN
jgi:hypothetical protein